MNEFLSDTARILESRHSIPGALQRVARVLIPHIGDFCLIFLARGRDLTCVASAHTTPDGERLLRRLNRIYRITRADPVSTVAYVVRTGRIKLRSEIASEQVSQFADLRIVALHQRLQVSSALVAPIGSAPAVRGALSLCYANSRRRYTSTDLPRARRLAALIDAFLRRRTLEPDGRPPGSAPRRSIRLRARA